MHWQRRPQGYVYVYDVDGEGRKVVLPREETKHLDLLSDSEIEEWVAREGRERQYKELLAKFRDYRLASGKCARSVGDQLNILTSKIAPYFGTQSAKRWPKFSIGLTNYLIGQGLSRSRIRYTLITLSQFWRFLVEEGEVSGELLIRKPPILEAPTTPLVRTLSPGEVLKYAQRMEPPLSLLALLGYFFSLRTQELLALRRRDFLAGARAEALECCKAMSTEGLYSRLAVRISRQRRMGGELHQPKTSYANAWVACFNEEAARLIVDIINGLPPSVDFLFTRYKPDYYIRKWGREGIESTTLKDLRRASLYYLGNDRGMEVVRLKHHARHSVLSTTLLYCRRPEEEADLGTNPLILD